MSRQHDPTEPELGNSRGTSTERRLRAYVALVAALAAGSLLLPPTWSGPAGMWLMALIVLLPLSIALEFVSVPLPSGGSFSMATVPHVATILLVPPPLAAASIGLAVLLEQVAHRSPPVRMTFNVAGTVLTASLASYLMGRFGNVWDTGSADGILLPLPLVAVAVTYFVVNAVLLGIVLAIVDQRSIRSMLRPEGSTVAPELAATAIGAQYALVWTIDPILVLLIALPAWVIAQSFEYIRRLASETQASVRSLAQIIDHRDATTFRHSERVAENAVRLARALGMPEPEVSMIEQAAGVHDVGKIGVPDAVLLKTGLLTSKEQVAMRRHTELGAQILTGFRQFRPGADIVRHHHEEWDGGGYPDGLAGTAIPLGARVVAVVDAFDAMTSDRPYRLALDRAEALARIADGAGGQWDPDIVRVFLELEGYVEDADRKPVSSATPQRRRRQRRSTDTIEGSPDLEVLQA
jgi:putative nucleotidyltransferase with HDIG domain